MQQYFQLASKEKKQEWLMLALAILSFLTLAKGLYNQYHKIDQDYLLVPLLCTIYCSLLLVYGINGLTKGNLIQKWTPFFIFPFVCFFIKIVGSVTQDKAKAFATKLLGAIACIISLGFFVSAIALLTENK